MNRSNVAFHRYVVLSAAGIAGYFLLPSALQNVALIGSNLVALTAIIFSWRTRRLTPTPGWLLLAAFPAATAVGNTVYFVNDSILHVDPFPSIGDASFLAGYVLLAAGLLQIQHERSDVIDATAILDAAIITVAFAAASWVFFMAPLLQDSETPLLERLVALGYPVGDVLVLAVAARFFLSARRAGPVFRWLAVTVGVMLVADTGFVALNLLDRYATGNPIDVLILAYNLGWGAVALHRDASELTVGPDPGPAKPGWWRLVALAAASLVPATVLLVQVIRGDLQEVPVTAGAGLLLFLLVTVRMSALVHALETVLVQRGALEREVAASSVELNRIASIVTSSSDAVVGLSLDGRVTSWNPAAERLYGRPAAEAVKQTQTIVSPEQFARFRAGLVTATDAAEVASQEVHVTRADGSTVPVAMSVSPILNGDLLTGISVIGRDITEWQRAEAALKEARAEALEGSRLKSEFLATMSHEIRTPMNGVIGLTGLLLETSLDDLQRQYAQGAYSAGESLLTLINDILDFSKLEAGKVELESIDFDPRRLVDEVGVLLAREAGTKGLELLAHCVPDVPALLTGDAGRIRQVLLNLASNAVKFTAAGEVEIRLQTISTTNGSVLARFEVSDTGVGIPADSHQRLFNSFSQADASTTRRYGGSGLGLAICLRLVEAMDGEIGLDSEVGTGSRFWFQIPLCVVTGAQQPPGPELTTGLRVLVVDDNATSRTVLSDQLTAWELETDVTADGPSALVQTRRAADAGQPYDIAVIDMGMPQMNGLQLAQAISAERALRHTRLLVLTSALDQQGPALTKAGVTQWLTKPVTSAALVRQLQQLTLPTAVAVGAAPLEQRPNEHPDHQHGRILVVEDNALNQLVAEGVLAFLGYQPHIVANGLEALTALSHGDYAAVLMDCHMPVMDGYAATREIRRAGPNSDIPIIAMTASAMTDDRERALAAGMNDYVTKPIVMQTMADLLAQWTRPQPGRPVPPTVPSGGPADAAAAIGPVLDQDRLNSLRQLGEAKGVNIIPQLTQLFTRDGALSVSDMREAVRSKNWPGLEEAAHKLRGAATNLGAARVAALCEELEIRAGDTRRVPGIDVVSELDAELDRAFSALQSHEYNAR